MYGQYFFFSSTLLCPVLLNYTKRKLQDLQVRDAFSGLSLLSDIIPFEKLLVFGFQQGVARTGLREDEERHGFRSGQCAEIGRRKDGGGGNGKWKGRCFRLTVDRRWKAVLLDLLLRRSRFPFE